MTKTKGPTQWAGKKEESLKHVSSLLHLVHHRNKNQHRRSHWYRHFDTFRRQLNVLVSQISILNEQPLTHVAKARKRVQDKDIQIRVQKLLEAWEQIYVPKWLHAFSQLVADGRFAPLGLALVAALAEVCEITGIIADLEDAGQAEMQRVLHDFAGDWAGSESDLPIIIGEKSDDDVGVVIERPPSPIKSSESNEDELTGLGKSTQNDGSELSMPGSFTPPNSTTEVNSKISSRRKLKSDNAEVSEKKKNRKAAKGSIDDLFKGLV